MTKKKQAAKQWAVGDKVRVHSPQLHDATGRTYSRHPRHADTGIIRTEGSHGVARDLQYIVDFDDGWDILWGSELRAASA